jgi:hypothetical protein
MRPRFNPDLVGAELELDPDELPSRYDGRQADLLPAAWTLASLAGLASEGIASVSLHEAAGWGGLVAASHKGLLPMPSSPGSMLPVGRLVASVTELTHAHVCTTSRLSTVSVLALEHDHGWRILVASRDQAARRLVLKLPLVATRVEALMLAVGPGTWQPISASVRGKKGIGLDLPPWGVARIDVA